MSHNGVIAKLTELFSSPTLPPCGGGLGKGVAASSMFVAYPPPERFAFDLPLKGEGNKNERPS
jgi:hypothetical protein